MPERKPISRDRLVQYLDDYLKIASIPDDSLNGLQVEGSAAISRAAFAVDACMRSIRAAARSKAQILIVHHGLFWGKRERITGVMHRRLSALMANRISLYAAHLPLDCHEHVGNNVELARILRFEILGKFASYHGVEIGVLAKPEKVLHRNELLKRLERILNTRTDMLSFGSQLVRKAGIISGGAGLFVAEAKEKGCDSFITGERSHAAYHVAKDAGINVIYAGH
jgi:dinuclear metal center YbgI/SA1388 family protein